MIVQAQGIVSTTTVMSGMVAIGVVGMLIDVLLRQGEAWLRRSRGLDA
jgi:NitT/TauT family transport system permease protein